MDEPREPLVPLHTRNVQSFPPGHPPPLPRVTYVDAQQMEPSADSGPVSPFAISRNRKLIALAIAGVSDAVSVFTEFAPPVQWVIDGATAAALFAVFGFRWPLLPPLVIEAIPGLAAFPTWIVAVSVLVGVTPTRPS